MIIPGVSHGLANKEFSSKVRNVNNNSMVFFKEICRVAITEAVTC